MAELRRAVRVICVDPSRSEVLLLLWRDPVDPGNLFWEPPGGGIEAGEDETAAAVREVLEETGLLVTPVPGWRVVVQRDVWWNGRRHVGPEPFLLAEVDQYTQPVPPRLTSIEQASLVETRWHPVAELGALAEPVEPPELVRLALAVRDHSTGR